MLILSLPLLGLGSKSTSLRPGLYVGRPFQYNMISWELDPISGFFVFFWLIVCADVINKCGWCLARGRGCWLKGLQQDPKCKLIISSFLTFPYLIHWLICTRNIVLLLQMMEGMGGGPWFISECGWRDRWWISSDSFCFFFVFFLFLYFLLLGPQTFYDGCYVCFNGVFFCFLSLVPIHQELLVHRNSHVCCVRLF